MVKKEVKKAQPKKGAAAEKPAKALVLCGNDTCFLRGECARFTKDVEVKFAARKRKCEHFEAK
jgi:hypothetical protein